MIGRTLSHYKVVEKIGEGGMGEVYLAKDSRLDRNVAIKVLPSHLADNPDLKSRFEREARAVSSLNHPHICTLHDIGEQDGTDFLVMEYIEGETLAERLKKGPLPLEQVIRCGVEIADALDKAHRQGVVHRDLKPGNIMLTKSGAKLLDFGLAKLRASPPGQEASVLSAVPTEEKPLTKEGSILGTFQYMAPEQLEGKDADARTDIFAFGAVLYEMVTGRKAFEGKSQASLIAAIMSAEPRPISGLQPLVPLALDRSVRKCLRKDPVDRWYSAHDLRDELQWLGEAGSHLDVARTKSHKTRERLAWAVAAAAFLAWVMSITIWPSTESKEVQFFSIPPEENTELVGRVTPPVIAPDGRKLAFSALDQEGKSLIWVRFFDSARADPLPGTDGGIYKFWSADSRFIGFVADGKLKKVDLFGTPPVALCDVSGVFRGGAWNRDGVILFSDRGDLYHIPDAGGHATLVSQESEDHKFQRRRYPEFLPDGRHFLFTAISGTEETSIWVGSLDSNETKRLLTANSNGAYAPPGYVIYIRNGTLWSQPFDADRMQLMGDPKLLLEDVKYFPGTGQASFTVSDTGVLAYGGGTIREPLIWLDRAGTQVGYVGDPPVNAYSFAISPDGSEVALECLNEANATDIWVHDLARDVSLRLTSAEGWTRFPIWSPDGDRLAYRGEQVLTEIRTAGTESGQSLLEIGSGRITDWSPDGKFILYESNEGLSDSDLLLFPYADSREPTVFLQSDFNEVEGRFSPDGRWVAYASDESGRFEVYVTSFPSGEDKHVVSREGGFDPRWRRDGKELFYIAPDGKLMAVPIKIGSTIESGTPQALFETELHNRRPRRYYDIAPDGQRFLITDLAQPLSAFTVVLNWTAELEK